MATPAYMSVTGKKQGLITAGAFSQESVGGISQKAHEDKVMVQAFSHCGALGQAFASVLGLAPVVLALRCFFYADRVLQ